MALATDFHPVKIRDTDQTGLDIRPTLVNIAGHCGMAVRVSRQGRRAACRPYRCSFLNLAIAYLFAHRRHAKPRILTQLGCKTNKGLMAIVSVGKIRCQKVSYGLSCQITTMAAEDYDWVRCGV
jgi:hypothetical protein